MLYWELNIVGVYLSPACGGGKITSTQYSLVIKVFWGWCAKGIVIYYNGDITAVMISLGGAAHINMKHRS